MSISVLFRLKNVVNVDILFTGKCKTKLSMCYSLQTSADGRRIPRPGRAGSELADTIEIHRIEMTSLSQRTAPGGQSRRVPL